MSSLLKIVSAVKNHSIDNGALSAGANIIDRVPTKVYGSVGWTVTFRRSDGERARYTVDVVHNGTTLVDATDGQYETSGGATTSGAVDQIAIAVALSGVGVSQALQLVATVAAGSWSVDVSRSHHVGHPG